MTDGATYSIGASGVTVNGLSVEAEKVSFTTSYQRPTMYSEMTLTNLCEQGVVQVDSKLISIEGKVYSLNKPYNNTNGNPSQSDIPNYSENNEIVDIPFELSLGINVLILSPSKFPRAFVKSVISYVSVPVTLWLYIVVTKYTKFVCIELKSSDFIKLPCLLIVPL